jgi:hypothetical protein
LNWSIPSYVFGHGKKEQLRGPRKPMHDNDSGLGSTEQGSVKAPDALALLPNRDFWEAGFSPMPGKYLIFMARSKRFELLTPRFVV